MTVTLCLLACNEVDGVRHDIPLIDQTKFDQIYCIDGGSTDGTVDYLEGFGIRIYQQQKRGSITLALRESCIVIVMLLYFFTPRKPF